MSQGESGKFRLQFDITKEALDSLDELVKATRASTRAELVRKAIKLYFFLHKECSEEGQVEAVVVKEGKEKRFLLVL